jgi:hypothetical protein
MIALASQAPDCRVVRARSSDFTLIERPTRPSGDPAAAARARRNRLSREAPAFRTPFAADVVVRRGRSPTTTAPARAKRSRDYALS